ncbi:hypothetical protein SAMN05421857_4121 [Chryseobacterium formosense]|nr:hypothetical protein SAMN05421857_4121 [Chryseobacterium formosense]
MALAEIYNKFWLNPKLDNDCVVGLKPNFIDKTLIKQKIQSKIRLDFVIISLDTNQNSR